VARPSIAGLSAPANIAANLALGAWTVQPSNVAKLALIPTALITTEIDDSADNKATMQLHAAFKQNPAVAPLHVEGHYPSALRVGHAMTDPENYRDDNGTWNRNWRTLYQENRRSRPSEPRAQRERSQPSRCALRDARLPAALPIIRPFSGPP